MHFNFRGVIASQILLFGNDIYRCKSPVPPKTYRVQSKGVGLVLELGLCGQGAHFLSAGPSSGTPHTVAHHHVPLVWSRVAADVLTVVASNRTGCVCMCVVVCGVCVVGCVWMKGNTCRNDTT